MCIRSSSRHHLFARAQERERGRGRVNACVVHRENVKARECVRAIEDVRLDSLLFSEREFG